MGTTTGTTSNRKEKRTVVGFDRSLIFSKRGEGSKSTRLGVSVEFSYLIKITYNIPLTICLLVTVRNFSNSVENFKWSINKTAILSKTK